MAAQVTLSTDPSVEIPLGWYVGITDDGRGAAGAGCSPPPEADIYDDVYCPTSGPANLALDGADQDDTLSAYTPADVHAGTRP